MSFLKLKCEMAAQGKCVVFVSSRKESVFYEKLLKAPKRSSKPDAPVANQSNIEQLMKAGTSPQEEEQPEPTLGDVPLFFLHGGMAQTERNSAFFAFCKTRKGVLFCTDVAARGLDFPKVRTPAYLHPVPTLEAAALEPPGLLIARTPRSRDLADAIPHLPRSPRCRTAQVSWIVQTSPPGSVAEYVHRCGRTARLDQQGSALVLLLPTEKEFLDVLRSHGLVAQPMSTAEMWSCMGTGEEARRIGVSEYVAYSGTDREPLHAL